MNGIEEQVRQLKMGNEEAFASLYSLFESSLLNHLYKMLGSQEKAEEAFQETMLKMIKKIDFYTPRPELKNSFKAWLFRIATNIAIDEIRKNKVIENIENAAIDKTHETIEHLDTKARINTLIMKLPAIQRTFLNLKVNEDLSHLEIATICGCQVNAVKQGLFRARKTLKDLLIQEGIGL